MKINLEKKFRNNVIPKEELFRLYGLLEQNVDFLYFQGQCDAVAFRYRKDGDFLSTWLMDIYECNHPEIM